MTNIFLPSMIEVEFGEFYKKCAQILFHEGFKSFHMDFGDKYLINRELECWDKVNFLKKLGKDIKLTAHIMSTSGEHKLSVEKITEKCINEGFEIIYIHPRSFQNYKNLYSFKEKFFKDINDVFGIVSEVSDKKDENLIDFALENSVHNLLQMGVPIGKGGQKFCWSAVKRMQDFTSIPSISNIELDGGLTFEVVKNIKKDNISKKICRFAGWSIIYDSKPLKVLSKAKDLLKII